MSTVQKGIHILVIDDEQGMRELLSFALENRGYKVTVAENGAEALEKVKAEKFHLIISDIMMPQMDGLTFLEKTKEIDPAVEVIITTGYGTIENAVAAMKKGAYDFVIKPFNVEEMYLLIERALEKRNMKALIGLYEASRAIHSAVHSDTLFNVVADLLQKVLNADQAAVLLFNDQRKTVFSSCRGIEAEETSRFHFAAAEGIAQLPAKDVREAFLLEDLRSYPELSETEKWGIQAALVCPLIWQNQFLGILSLIRQHNKDNFTASDVQSATIFATEVSLAVQNAGLYKSLEQKLKELEDAHRVLNETKDQLIQSEKMASVGRLVGGVAHEINNPLTAIIGYTQLVLEGTPQGETQRQLTVVYEQSQRCRKIVQDLMRFSRHQKLRKTKVYPALLIEETVRGLSPELQTRNVQVKRELPRQTLWIDADPDQLKTVFSNILVNALQALEAVSGPRQVGIKVSADGDYAQIAFSDNGPGIAPENLNKIFDPFFTTKDVGKGSGLGLSISYGIVREHGGAITAQSETGKGAVFIVKLPVHLESENEEASDPLAAPPLEKESLQTILLVEDEESIRDFVSTILKKKNYQIETAGDGETGLSKLQAKDYDLVLCDYRIPKLDGIQLYEKARQAKPQMAGRFLFITGSSGLVLETDYVKENNIRFLFKPFTSQDLIHAIQERLQLQK